MLFDVVSGSSFFADKTKRLISFHVIHTEVHWDWIHNKTRLHLLSDIVEQFANHIVTFVLSAFFVTFLLKSTLSLIWYYIFPNSSLFIYLHSYIEDTLHTDLFSENENLRIHDNSVLQYYALDAKFCSLDMSLSFFYLVIS